ncbi:MAG: 50S ribosomal protein L30 [Buchnera aphidicola (Chaetogeoica yunlongensis)]
MDKFISVTQVKSSIGRLPKHKATLIGLGLRYIGHTVKLRKTPDILGMIRSLSFMLKIN